MQESVNLLSNKLLLGAGLRWDVFAFNVRDRLLPAASDARTGARFQPKASLAYTPSGRVPFTLHSNYGRGISSMDARSILVRRDGARIATTDFYEVGTSHRLRRLAVATGAFWIDRSNELVYVADDGTLEFLGPSRAYGFESKASFDITRHLSFSGGLAKVSNAFYRGTLPRVYVDRAPHFVANAALTLAAWRGWSGSLRMRSINRFRLDGEDPAILAAGHTVFDLSLLKRLRRGIDFSFALDNLTNRLYYETQNYVESRPYRGGEPLLGIHGTPGYPLTVTAGLTFRFRGN
jgi:outer membrane receptor protein involved in Fe transport